jgi:UDP-glucose 4-epimerase
LYVGDAVKAMLRARACQAEWPVFNIGSGEGRDLNQVIATVEKLVGHPVERRYLPSRGFDVPANVLDITKARETLGWRPETSFEDGLRRTMEWMLRDSI